MYQAWKARDAPATEVRLGTEIVPFWTWTGDCDGNKAQVDVCEQHPV